MINEGFIQIGKTLGTTGYKGSLKVLIEDKYVQSFNNAGHLFLEDSPTPLPFFIDGRDEKDTLIVHFEELTSKEVSIEWTSKAIYLREQDLLPEERGSQVNADMIDLLISYKLVDHGEEKGVIIRVEEFPEQIMAIVLIRDKEHMIPLHPDLIQSIDHENKQVEMELPEGLLDL